MSIIAATTTAARLAFGTYLKVGVSTPSDKSIKPPEIDRFSFCLVNLKKVKNVGVPPLTYKKAAQLTLNTTGFVQC